MQKTIVHLSNSSQGYIGLRKSCRSFSVSATQRSGFSLIHVVNAARVCDVSKLGLAQSECWPLESVAMTTKTANDGHQLAYIRWAGGKSLQFIALLSQWESYASQSTTAEVLYILPIPDHGWLSPVYWCARCSTRLAGLFAVDPDTCSVWQTARAGSRSFGGQRPVRSQGNQKDRLSR